jgi:hypothetical protein
MVHNVVDAFLQIGNAIGKPIYQPLCNLTQKDATLGARVKKLRIRTSEEFLRQHVEHLVGKLWRSEHFVVAQVSQTRQYIGIIA